MIDFKTFTGDAITLHKNAENFIYEHIPMKAWIEQGKTQRQEKWLYPPDAIREGLANALAHRLYESTGKVQVRIFDDRMEIWNPGTLPPESALISWWTLAANAPADRDVPTLPGTSVFL